MRLLAWLAALGLGAGVGVRIASGLGAVDTALTVPLLGAFPLIVLTTGLLLVVLAGGSLVRHELRAPAALLTVVACVGVVIVAPTQTARAQPEPDGPSVTVATTNLRRGSASPTALARLAAEEGVDLLVTVESTPTFRDDLDEAGIRTTVPSRMNTRSGVAYATGDLAWRRQSRDRGGVPDLLWTTPDGAVVEVTTIHTPSPVGPSRTARWRRAIDEIRPPTDSPGIVIGDLNATLDHASLRGLLARTGWRDAADQLGEGLTVTYDGIAGLPTGLPMAIDHVLVSPGIAVEDVVVRDLPGSDHRMLAARLRLPGDT